MNRYEILTGKEPSQKKEEIAEATALRSYVRPEHYAKMIYGHPPEVQNPPYLRLVFPSGFQMVVTRENINLSRPRPRRPEAELHFYLPDDLAQRLMSELREEDENPYRNGLPYYRAIRESGSERGFDSAGVEEQ